MTTFTTEQQLDYTFTVVDGRGRPVAIDGAPVVATSDPTVLTVGDALPTGNPSEWKFTAFAVLAGTARVTVTVDADVTEAISEVIGFDDIEVTLDPRTAARMIALAPGTPVDKPL